MENQIKFYLVDNKRVTILQSFTHTHIVQFEKTKKVMEVHRRYVRRWSPKPKPKVKEAKPKKEDNKPQQLNFNF